MNDYLKDREVPEKEEKVESAFNKWLDTFIEEKGIDLEQVIEIKQKIIHIILKLEISLLI